MSRLNMDDNTLRRPTIESKLRLKTMTKTLAAAFTVTADLPPIITLDPGGATRQVVMPSETDEANWGLTFIIRNGANAAEDLTIRDSANAVTVGTISQDESALVTLAPAIAGAATYTWTVIVGATT
jgi:hypothetical protein